MSGFTDLPTQPADTMAPSSWPADVQADFRYLAGFANASANPEYSKPMGRFYRTTDQSAIASGDALTFDEHRGPLVLGNLGQSGSQITIPTGGDGWYQIGASLRVLATYSGSAGDSIDVTLRVNGTDVICVESRILPTGSGTAAHKFAPATLAYLSAADYLELIVTFSGLTSVALTAVAYYSPDVWLCWQGIGT